MAAKTGPSEYTYDIFLSFRGEDTRKIFTTRLYSALVDAGFGTFIDDNGIERGEDIKSELIRAIHHSRGSIVVLSKNYANSGWCLDELVMIVENKKSKGHVILPVFYHVTKSDVGCQMGSFAEAFAVYEKRCLEENDELKRSEWLSQIQKWRDALTHVAALGGMNFTLQDEDEDEDEDDDEYATGFIQKTVQVIEDKLNRAVLPGAHEFVGISSRVKEINAWLHNGSSEVGILVLCGIGGIGKTTIAKFVYNLNYELFETSSFLADIRETFEKPNGLLTLQRDLLTDIRGEQIGVDNVREGSVAIKAALEQKRTLLVLDDVDQVNQLDAILGMRNWLIPGSRIIITTRNKSLLKPNEVYKVHTIEPLDYDESLQLFSWHAFGQDYPFEHYMDFSDWVIERCYGLPLVLKVIGSSLFRKSLHVWISILRKLEEIPPNKIQELLRISYSSLPDEHDKVLFLHIACFFVDKNKDYIVNILDECGFHTMVGIQNLINRCLLTIDFHLNLLRMHQSLRDMGREVVRQESPRRPEARSRLCHYRDSLNVLKFKTGTEATRGLILDMLFESRNNGTRSDGNDSTNLSYINLETDAFKEMKNLELLQLDYVHLSGSFKHLPKNLKWFRWHGFSLNSIPDNFPMDELIALDMSKSRLVRFSKQTKIARFMKILDLSHSLLLVNTPEFSGFPNLESVILRGCINLSDVHKSLGYLNRLLLLDLHDCKSLSKLPKTTVLLKHLHTLVISGCTNLHHLPADMNKMTSLKVLNADGIAKSNFLITQEDDIGSSDFCGVRSLMLSKPTKAPHVSSWASLPNSLISLSLSNCNLTEDTFPNDIGNFTSLKELNLSRNPLRSLPHFVSKLSRLHTLQLESCLRLRSLLGLPDIKSLVVSDCKVLKTITHVSTSSKLHYISDTNCSNLIEIQGLFYLEPLNKFPVEMLNNLGFFEMELFNEVEVNFQDGIRFSTRKRPLQLLYEFGIFSASMPGKHIPDWFSYKFVGSSFSFIVPYSISDIQIQGLNLSFVYAVSNSISNNDETWLPENKLFIKISNRTKKSQWIYYPTCFGIPELPESDHLLWLSHWTFRNEVENGNEVDISIITGDNFVVKECGISFMYHEQEEDIQNKYLSWKEVIGGDLTSFRLSTGSYYLCRTSFLRVYEEEEVTRPDDWTMTKWGRRLFDGSIDLFKEMQFMNRMGRNTRSCSFP
ncbi:hypothetical protein ACJIZ3_003532 [Penstemon smallii]|uniref:TIR domain-containing protein n=1 Tax=Penstemon smallii TaxID=265156 RepID=A0ABD3U9G4_9LAMI